MSAWTEVFCLRVPAKELCFVGDLWAFCEAHENEPEFDQGAWPGWDFPYFSPAPTEEAFLDLVLSEEVTEHYGTFGHTRELNGEEKKKYLPLFLKFFPDCHTDKIRFVHYCYYDGAEAPDYYGPEED